MEQLLHMYFSFIILFSSDERKKNPEGMIVLYFTNE